MVSSVDRAASNGELMGYSFLPKLQNIWPLTLLKHSDLRESNELVKHLPVPDNTKRFVFAVRDRESQSVVYILAAQTLSERSASDAECLIKAVRPHAVVAQVDRSTVVDLRAEDDQVGDDVDVLLPTTFFGVVLRCFMYKIGKEKYETSAGKLVLKEIFGVGFHGHVLAARKAANEVGSSFLMLEAPSVRKSFQNDSCSEAAPERKIHGSANSLVPRKFDLSSSRRILPSSFSLAEANQPVSGEDETYDVPPFAQSIYPLLLDLHNVFIAIPLMKRAMISSQKMLSDVSQGAVVDKNIISEVYAFRSAVESLRMALNNAGRLPISKAKPEKVEFSELPVDEKSSALLAHALRSQARKFKIVVAVVDASSVRGLRRHWFTSLPSEVQDLITTHGDDEEPNSPKQNWMFSGKPVVALGAGATAVIGASSLSKVAPASSLIKMASLKLPTSLKILLTHTQKMANAYAMKGAFSAEKFRTVSHSLIASIEKTSFSAMRTSFYEIMRTRRVKPMGALPWATFGGSVATCSALLLFGDSIESAVVSLPAASSLASLGRGVQNLRLASQQVSVSDVRNLDRSLDSLMNRLKVKIR